MGDVKRMFHLFRGSPSVGIVSVKPALDLMSKTFQKYIEDTGAVIVQKLKAQRVVPDEGEEGTCVLRVRRCGMADMGEDVGRVGANRACVHVVGRI